ncbi:MAG: helix-turn-helix domain-containing protein [Anaerorhabdus sp.]
MLGDKLKYLRKLKNIKQKDLADHSNITVSAYSQYENNKRQPDYNTLLSLANYLEVSTDELLGAKPSLIDEDPRFNNFKFALMNGENELTNDQKEDLLSYYEFLKSRNK